jgi:hypothetical protein
VDRARKRWRSPRRRPASAWYRSRHTFLDLSQHAKCPDLSCVTCLRGDTQGAFTHPTESARNGVVTVSVSKAWNRLLDDGDEDLALADVPEGDTSGFGA